MIVPRFTTRVRMLFEFIDFCLSGMLANIHKYFTCCHQFDSLLSNLSKILHGAFLLSVSIDEMFGIFRKGVRTVSPEQSLLAHIEGVGADEGSDKKAYWPTERISWTDSSVAYITYKS